MLPGCGLSFVVFASQDDWWTQNECQASEGSINTWFPYCFTVASSLSYVFYMFFIHISGV